ncbi:MAG TPA: DoxX family protein, partial [Edaphobacter sp.]|nr:DoxX family protein [Edaphobacter sp.]
LLACTILYAIPRTSVFGAILLTGYLGGAIALQLRVGNPLFSHVLFPVYIALLIWGGIFLRENRLRTLVPLRS